MMIIAGIHDHSERLPGSFDCLESPAPQAAHMSAVIDVLRFPLISLVVLYHAFNCSVTLPPGSYDWHQPVTDFIYWKLLHDAIARSAVPLFFALSGYLHFLRPGRPSQSWWTKLRKRFSRLWIPLWTWAGLALLFLGILYAMGLPNAGAQDIFGKSHLLSWWVDGFLGLKNVSGPHFFFAGWFVRDLFFVGLLSPLWHILLKHRVSAILTLSALYMLYLTVFAPLPFLGSRAMFFFCLGSAYAIHHRDFAADAEKAAGPCLLLWGSGFAIGLFARVPFLPALTTTFLIPVLVAVGSWGVRRHWLRPVPWLAESAFFVYFCHESLWLRVPWDMIRMHLFIPYGDWACLWSILLNWVGGSILPLVAFFGLRRFIPGTLVLLCGLPPHKGTRGARSGAVVVPRHSGTVGRTPCDRKQDVE